MTRPEGKSVAEKHAQNVRDYWAARGKKVNVWVVKEAGPDSPIYEVKSDMIDGLPMEMKA